MSAKELYSTLKNPNNAILIILKHEKSHYGHSLRIEGMKKFVNDSRFQRKSIFEILTGTMNYQVDTLKEVFKEKGKDFLIATLGNRGTEAALSVTSNIPIMGMDINNSVRKAILRNQMIGTIVQKPSLQGENIIQIARWSIKADIHSGPFLVTRENIAGY